MNNQPKNKNLLKNHQKHFHIFQETSVVKVLKKKFKNEVKQVVVQSLPMIMKEFAEKLLIQQKIISEKKHEEH